MSIRCRFGVPCGLRFFGTLPPSSELESSCDGLGLFFCFTVPLFSFPFSVFWDRQKGEAMPGGGGA